MRILVHDYTGHPFQVQLSRELARRGHTVLHLFSALFQTPKGALTVREGDPETFDVQGLRFGEVFHKHSFVKRYWQEQKYGKMLAAKIFEFKPDVVISANNPLDPQKLAFRACKRLNVPMVHWLQDVYSVAVNKLLRRRMPIAGAIVGSHYTRMERRLLHEAAAVVAITADFRPLLHEWGVADEKVHVVHNWSPLEEIPQRPRINDWRTQQEFGEEFLFLYAGTLGMKHNPELLLNLARHYRDDANVRVVVASEGPGADWLADHKREEKLERLSLLPFQPWEEMPGMLGASDVLIAILEKDAGIFSVPSKVLTYLCAGRSLLVAVPENNLASKTVTESNSGLAGEPDDSESFLRNAVRLQSDDKLRAEMSANARKYAETHFDIQTIGDRFLEIIAGL